MLFGMLPVALLLQRQYGEYDETCYGLRFQPWFKQIPYGIRLCFNVIIFSNALGVAPGRHIADEVLYGISLCGTSIICYTSGGYDATTSVT